MLRDFPQASSTSGTARLPLAGDPPRWRKPLSIAPLAAANRAASSTSLACRPASR